MAQNSQIDVPWWRRPARPLRRVISLVEEVIRRVAASSPIATVVQAREAAGAIAVLSSGGTAVEAGPGPPSAHPVERAATVATGGRVASGRARFLVFGPSSGPRVRPARDRRARARRDVGPL